MNIDPHELSKLMIDIANELFGASTFRRRQLMNATEQAVRQRGLWTSEDNSLSGSVGLKSKGLAYIDWQFSELKRLGAIISQQRNVWKLAKPKAPPPKEFIPSPPDISELPNRADVRISRIVRDTNTALALKSLYEFRCQICAIRIEPSPGTYYVEVHHVKPLGGGHNGLDTTGNMLVLCPNHHAMFDFGMPRFLSTEQVEIAGAEYKMTVKHQLSPEVISYHNKTIHSRLHKGD